MVVVTVRSSTFPNAESRLSNLQDKACSAMTWWVAIAMHSACSWMESGLLGAYAEGCEGIGRTVGFRVEGFGLPEEDEHFNSNT